ncbi:MAG: 2-dehydropantoate 2-reductase, partial [Deltaproteobacteria bacterium CG17_big_fil_post_rev_8_21_14_2_50_51_6]
MNILVVGPGAMGCLFAARLKDAGNNVALLDYREQRAATISRQGVIVEDGGRSTSVNVPAFAEGTAFSPEVIIVFVKSAQTNDAALNASRWALPDSIVLTLQNGLGNL